MGPKKGKNHHGLADHSNQRAMIQPPVQYPAIEGSGRYSAMRLQEYACRAWMIGWWDSQ